MFFTKECVLFCAYLFFLRGWIAIIAMVRKMKTFYEIQQLLKRYGMIVYTGSRLGDLELMEDEVQELYDMKILEKEDYLVARMILRNEINKERDKHE